MTSESTRFLGQPNEIKPTEGAVGGGSRSLICIGNGKMALDREAHGPTFPKRELEDLIP